MPQGTIKTYDGPTKCGSLLDDTGDELSFDGASFEGSGVRLFRIGQRVKYQVEGEGTRRRVRSLTLVTL